MAQFRKGQSGNPGGRPKGVRASVVAVCGKDGKKLVKALWDIASDTKDAPPAARVAAIKELLDRGYGKVTQPVGGDEDAPLAIIIQNILRSAEK